MADTELHETDSEDQKDWQAETDADVKDTDTNETDEADDDYGVSMDKVQAVLNATAKLCCCHTLFAVSLLHGADDDMTAIDGRRAEQIHIAAVCQLEFPAQLDSGQREVAHCDIRPVDAR